MAAVTIAQRVRFLTDVEGVADLAFREIVDGQARWTVVDFKTDRRYGERRPEYEAQVAQYAEALGLAMEEPAEGVVLAL